jgi:hypothetical protein
MAGQIRLFEKTADGLLVEVAPADADARRLGRLVSRVSLEIDVLWTEAESAERLAEEERTRADRRKMAEEQESRRARKAAAEAKLQALGISPDELKDAIG